MIRQAYDRDSVGQYVEAIRQQLSSPQLSDAVARAAAALPGEGDAVAKVSAALTSVQAAAPSSGGEPGGRVPYLARDPAVSLVQSTLEGALRDEGVRDEPVLGHEGLWDKIVHTAEDLLHPGNFSPDDPDWVVKVGEAMLGRLAQGNHEFNPKPAARSISDTARLVVVGDWGTGLPRAQKVARLMTEEVAEALGQGRQAHVIHLGDVYYSGLPSEVDQHVLRYWPVSAAQTAAGVTSWSLNGNHDMYSGGFGYYDTMLADPRFAAQHSPDGASTSFFRLNSPSWEFVGLDTSWDTDVLSQGASAVLQDPQAEFVASVARESDRKLVLFSHHQLVSVYDKDDLGPVLTGKLGSLLSGGRVTGWWWGHEHRCMGFTADQGVQTLRCIGHGGVPVLQNYTAGAPLAAPGAWQASGFISSDGQDWALFGFAVFDLDGGQMQVRYRDETGATIHTETVG